MSNILIKICLIGLILFSMPVFVLAYDICRDKTRDVDKEEIELRSKLRLEVLSSEKKVFRMGEAVEVQFRWTNVSEQILEKDDFKLKVHRWDLIDEHGKNWGYNPGSIFHYGETNNVVLMPGDSYEETKTLGTKELGAGYYKVVPSTARDYTLTMILKDIFPKQIATPRRLCRWK